VPGRRVPIFALERRNWDYRDESSLWLAAGNGFVCVAFIRTARATPHAETMVDVFSGSRIIRQTAIANPLLRNRFRRVRSGSAKCGRAVSYTPVQLSTVRCDANIQRTSVILCELKKKE